MNDSDGGFVSKNIEIDNLPRVVDRFLSTYAHLRGATKKSVIRQSLIEFAKNHQEDLERLVKGEIKNG